MPHHDGELGSETKLQKYKSGSSFLTGLIVLIASLGAINRCSTPVAWIAIMAFLIVFIFILGASVTGRWLGILITEQNLMSLARFQAVIWTVIVISAYFVIAVARVNNRDKLEKAFASQASAAVTPTPTPTPSGSSGTQTPVVATSAPSAAPSKS